MKNTVNGDLIYQLNDKPTLIPSTFAAIQHVLASIVGIVTPILIVAGTLGLQQHISYLVSCTLITSGIGTFIQSKKFGPVGSGMLCIQGTSFTFLTVIIATGFMVKERGGTDEQILAAIFGVTFITAVTQIILSGFIYKLRRILTPVVTGTIIILIGIPLIQVAATDMGGGFGAEDLGSLKNLSLAFIVIATVIILNRTQNQFLRLSSIVIALIIGMLAALLMGRLDTSSLNNIGWITIPIPFQYGFGFEFSAIIPLIILHCVTALETTGDLTANSIVSKQPIKGPIYLERIRGGILANGINSLIAATLNSMPNTTFSQNNGVISLTGVASRYIGMYVAGVLFLLGLLPIFGAVLQIMPKPVLGGATLIMFGTVAAAGIKVAASARLDSRDMLILAISVGLGLSVSMVPDILGHFPEAIRNLFGSPVAVGAISAILLSLFLPATDEDDLLMGVEESLNASENDEQP